MKIIEMHPHRLKHAIKLLEKKMAELAQQSASGTAEKMKLCFAEWVKRSNSLK